MADSLVSTVSRFLTPDTIGKLASAAGLDQSTAQKGIAAALPAILSGLASVAAKPSGARQLASATAEHPADLLGGFAGLAGGTQQMADNGNSLLSSLFGSGMSGLLASTIGRFTGIGERPMRMLMGLLVPLIMGVLGREQRSAGLDADGLARTLVAQKDDITAAMPAGLGRMLDASGFREGVGITAAQDRFVHDVSRPSHDAPRAPLHAASNARTISQSATWPYWVLPLVALGLLWFLLPTNESAVEVRDTSPATTSAPEKTAQDASVRLTYVTNARADWTSIGSSPNEYTSRDIYNAAGENIGTIRDLLVGSDGKPAAVIIHVGRFLGIGDKQIGIPFSALRIERNGDNRRIVVDASRDGVQAAPAFSTKLAAPPGPRVRSGRRRRGRAPLEAGAVFALAPAVFIAVVATLLAARARWGSEPRFQIVRSCRQDCDCLPFVHPRLFLDEEAGDRAALLGDDRNFHFHRLDDHHRLAGLQGLADGRHDLPDRAGDVRFYRDLCHDVLPCRSFSRL
jgi:hypothetical protein